MTKAAFSIIDIEPHWITISDKIGAGKMSITNDAEAVVEHLLRRHPGKRIFYYDSDGYLDELAHDGVRFTGFKAGPNSRGKGVPS